MQNINSEPSLDLFQFINPDEEGNPAENRLNHHYSHDFEINPHLQFAEHSSRPVSNQNMFLHDEVELLNTESLILIKAHAVLIRYSVDEHSASLSQ
jgi:hypothetical protein